MPKRGDPDKPCADCGYGVVYDKVWPSSPTGVRQFCSCRRTFWDGDGPSVYIPSVKEMGEIVLWLMAVVEAEDGFDANGIPSHDCGYVNRPESGYCEFHEKWVNAMKMRDFLKS